MTIGILIAVVVYGVIMFLLGRSVGRTAGINYGMSEFLAVIKFYDETDTLVKKIEELMQRVKNMSENEKNELVMKRMGEFFKLK